MGAAKELLPLLRCPLSGAPVHCDNRDATHFWSEDSAGSRIDYPSVSGQPVLIDFGKSIANREAVLASGGASLVENRRAGRSVAKRVVFGGNPVELGNAKRLAALLKQDAGERRPVVLVVGGGSLSGGVRYLRDNSGFQIVCFDIYASDQTDFVADAHAIPLKDGVVDGVWVQAVLEHVLTPATVVEEIARVLRPGGLVYAETPFLQPVHEKAYDFTRFTESGHRWLFRQFEEIDSGVVSGSGATLFLHLRYFAGAVLRNRRLGNLAALPFFWLRYFDRIIPRAHASDMASGVHFLGRKSERALEPAEMPAFFKGVR
jgi:SAM-dependent methyltransferase